MSNKTQVPLKTHLDDDVGGEGAGVILPDVTVDIVVRDRNLEISGVLDIDHAGVGSSLGVDLAVEEGRRGDPSQHLRTTTLDTDLEEHLVISTESGIRGHLQGSGTRGRMERLGTRCQCQEVRNKRSVALAGSTWSVAAESQEHMVRSKDQEHVTL